MGLPSPTYASARFLENAPMIPAGELKPRAPPYLPMVHSVMEIGSPTRKNETTYAIMNAAPPYMAT